MKYPSTEEYGQALQFPQKTLLDPTLASGTVELDSMKLPFGRSGGFALTFKIRAGGKDYAFRCFYADRTTMAKRYAAISSAVSRASLSYFVNFHYLDPGIRIQAQAFPAIMMDWAEGRTLGIFIEQHLNDPGRLLALQQQLHGMALALEGAGIAHGDIQPGNIVVGPSGDVKLVDYDGMFVPAISSLGSIETGHRHFQHPGRMLLEPFDSTLDRFSFAVMHAGLAALAERPSLWNALKGDPDALLLRDTDFADPGNSVAFNELVRLPKSGIIYQRLRAIAAGSYQEIPSFSDFLNGRNIPQYEGLATTSGFEPLASTPWYLQSDGAGEGSNAGPGPTAAAGATGETLKPYQSNYPVVSASDSTACSDAADAFVELIGCITDIKHDASGISEPYVTLNFAGSYAFVSTAGIASLAAGGMVIDETWNGQWVSISGQMRQNPTGKSMGITIISVQQLTLLNAPQARWRLHQADTSTSTRIPPAKLTNAKKLEALTPGTSEAKTAPGLARPNVTPPKSDSGWKLPVAILVAILVVVLASISLYAAAINSENSSNTPDGATQVDTAGIAPPQGLVGRCVTEARSFIDCGFGGAYKIVDVAASDCGGNTISMPYVQGGFLCLEATLVEPPPAPVQPVLYETCFAAGKDDPECTTGETTSWNYSYCWNRGGAVLEQFLNGSWRTVKQGISKQDDCLPKFPWTVEFDRKVTGVGTRKYRLYFPANDRFNATIEQITVTVKPL